MTARRKNFQDLSKMDGRARREQITDGIRKRTGIDAEMIRELVQKFYASARTDDLLGPVFEANVHDWHAHFDQMCSFWSSVALLTGSYHGRPFEKHASLPLEDEHFDRWLELFGKAAREVCPDPAAEHFIERALRIADSLRAGANRRLT